DIELEVENNSTPWASGLGKVSTLLVPPKHGEGRCQADEETLKRFEGEDRVVFRHVANSNGSRSSVAGQSSEQRNVVGLMPHPEHAVEELTGPSPDGLGMFQSVLHSLV